MKLPRSLYASVFLIMVNACQTAPPIELTDARGYLLIIGGGSRPDKMIQRDIP